MVVVIILIIIGILVWAVKAGLKLDKAKRAFLTSHEGWDVYVSPDFKQVIAIDHDGRRVAVGPLASPIEVAWADVAGCEVERNGQSITATNRGSQVMGAAVGTFLLGPAGLLLGGLTGSKRSIQNVSELSLLVTVDNRLAPVHRIVFVKLGGKGKKPDSPALKPAVERLEHFHALLSNIVKREDKTPVGSAQQTELPQSASEQIEQLWALHQSGALTTDEFAAAKARLLAGSNHLTGAEQ